MITLAFTDDKPLYRQLYEHLRHQILTGELKENESLPSKRTLAEHLNISQNTVLSAYHQLQDEGYIHSEERRGYFVSSISCHALPALEPKLDRPKEEAPLIRYDFSHHAIDPLSFPVHTWARLSREVLYDHRLDLTREGHPAGHERLRQSIATYLKANRGLSVSPDQILIRSGIESLLPILFRLLPKPLHFAIEDPGYDRFQSILDDFHIPYTRCPLDEAGLIIQKDCPANIIATTPSHQFPTGKIMPIGRRTELLYWAAQREGYILEDDYDSEFKYRGRPIPPMKALDVHDRIIYMGSFSKCLSPALRVSYLVLPKKLSRREILHPQLNASTVPILTQLTLSRFMDEGYFDRHLNRMRHRYRKKRELLVNYFQSWLFPHAITGADAGLHVVLTLPEEVEMNTLLTKATHRGFALHAMSRYTDDPRYHHSLLLGFGAMDEETLLLGIEELTTMITAERIRYDHPCI